MQKKKQYYFYCIHEGTKSKISSSCKVMIHLKSSSKSDDKEEYHVASISTIDYGHYSYSKYALKNMLKISEIPDILKESAKKYFLQGWNVSEIFSKLKKDHHLLHIFIETKMLILFLHKKS